MKIRIEHCSLGLTRLEWGMIYRQQHHPIGHEYVAAPVFGQTVENARNLVLSNGIRDEVDIIFFYDDDMLPRGQKGMPTLIDTLVANPEVTAISGVYPMKAPLPSPVVFKERFSGPWMGWRDGGIHEVYAAGTGFTAINLRQLVQGVTLPEQYQIKDVDLPVYRFVVCNNDMTDDFALAEWMLTNDKKWYVHGDVICDQIDLRTGKVFRVEEYEKATIIEAKS